MSTFPSVETFPTVERPRVVVGTKEIKISITHHLSALKALP